VPTAFWKSESCPRLFPIHHCAINLSYMAKCFRIHAEIASRSSRRLARVAPRRRPPWNVFLRLRANSNTRQRNTSTLLIEREREREREREKEREREREMPSLTCWNYHLNVAAIGPDPDIERRLLASEDRSSAFPALPKAEIASSNSRNSPSSSDARQREEKRK